MLCGKVWVRWDNLGYKELCGLYGREGAVWNRVGYTEESRLCGRMSYLEEFWLFGRH